jgi:hypothetical protein
MATEEVIEENMLESHSGNCNGFVSRRETYVSSSLTSSTKEPRLHFAVIRKWVEGFQNLRALTKLGLRISSREFRNNRRLGTLPIQKNKLCGQSNRSV